QDELAPGNVYGVTCVVSALIPRDEIEVGGQQVDDLPFAFVAPLCTQYGKVHTPDDFTRLSRPNRYRRRQRSSVTGANAVSTGESKENVVFFLIDKTFRIF